MRLGVILDRFRRERGGTERYLFELARRLVARGHEVRVYCLEGDSGDSGAALVRVAAPAWPRARRERLFAERASARARAEGCAPLLGVRHVVDVDVYQPHGGTWAASVAARLACDRRPWRRALRAALHRASPKQRRFLHADREVFARRPRLLTLAVSPLVRDDVLARYGRFEPRVEVVFPAIELAAIEGEPRRLARERWRREAGARAEAPLLAFVAHDFELKGLDGAIEAFARSEAARAGGRLLVAGRGAAAPGRRLAERLGVGEAVRFLGASGEIASLLAASDLLLHPTHYDPCALVTLEALAAGVPVVTTARNGAAALLAEGGGRVVGEPRDVGALAGAIDAVLQERERASEQARAIGGALGWERHLARIEPLLESGWREGRADAREGANP